MRARLRTIIKALLKRCKYPPGKQAEAVELVLKQKKVIAEGWAREELGEKIKVVVTQALEQAIRSEAA